MNGESRPREGESEVGKLGKSAFRPKDGKDSNLKVGEDTREP